RGPRPVRIEVLLGTQDAGEAPDRKRRHRQHGDEHEGNGTGGELGRRLYCLRRLLQENQYETEGRHGATSTSPVVASIGVVRGGLRFQARLIIAIPSTSRARMK